MTNSIFCNNVNDFTVTFDNFHNTPNFNSS